VELTLKATMPDAPCFVVDPDRMEAVTGYAGRGPTIMSVDNLPCELPRESSLSFSAALKDMVVDLANTDFRTGFESLMLPSYLKKAVITHRGALTPGYRYLQEFLDRAGR